MELKTFASILFILIGWSNQVHAIGKLSKYKTKFCMLVETLDWKWQGYKLRGYRLREDISRREVKERGLGDRLRRKIKEIDWGDFFWKLPLAKCKKPNGVEGDVRMEGCSKFSCTAINKKKGQWVETPSM